MAKTGIVQRFAEASMPRDELLKRARQLNWYHTLRLDEDLVTPGIFDLDSYVPYYLLPESLDGMDCLDVGAGSGYWSFAMERRGARHVTAADIGNYADTDFSTPFEPMADGCPKELSVPAGSIDPAYSEPFRVAASLLRSKVENKVCSVYELSPRTIGLYNIVFCGSMLMHLFDPLVALRRMASVCRNICLICTQTDLSLEGRPQLLYMGHQEAYSHFIPSPCALEKMIWSCGYREVVRGPTFNLHYRDRIKDPSPLSHTTFLGLREPERSSVPPPGLVSAHGRRAGIEIISAPSRVSVRQSFEIHVRVRNISQANWRGSTGATKLGMAYEIQSLDRRGRVRSTQVVESELPFLDYLPCGLDSLATLVVEAPAEPGQIVVRPLVCQNGSAFESAPVTCTVAVDSGPRLPILPHRLRALLRRIRNMSRLEAR